MSWRKLSLSPLRSNLPPLRNLRVMYLRVSNFRCRYLHAVSTSPLHNTYTLRKPLSEAQTRTSCLQQTPITKRLTRFCPRYQPVIPTKTWLSRQDNEHHCLHRAFLFPFPFLLPRGRFLRLPFPSVLFVSAPWPIVVFGPQVEREQIRYPLTSTSEFGILIAVNSTAVCSQVAQLTRVLSELQRCLSRGMLSVGEVKLC